MREYIRRVFITAIHGPRSVHAFTAMEWGRITDDFKADAVLTTDGAEVYTGNDCADLLLMREY